MIHSAFWSLTLVLVPPNAFPLQDPSASEVRLSSSIAYFREKLRESETRHDVKCWTTFRRIEDMLAGRDLQPRTAHLRAGLAREFARELWMRAGHLEPKASPRIAAVSVRRAFKKFFRIDVTWDGEGERASVQLPIPELGLLSLSRADFADYARTSEAWRVLLAAAQEPEGISRDLEPHASLALAGHVGLFNLALLKVAAQFSLKSKDPEITEEALREASSLLRMEGLFYRLAGDHQSPALLAQSLLAQSIWYAQDKISSLERVNGRVTDDARRRLEGEIAGMPLDPEASRTLRQRAVPELAREVWLRAQTKLPEENFLISGDQMYEAIRELFPYRADEEENIRFFPDSPEPIVLYAHWCDAFRDDTAHWRTILDLLTQEVDPARPGPSQLRSPLAPYAAEELSEILSHLSVLLLRRAAALAARGGGPAGPKEVREALRWLKNLSRDASRRPYEPAAQAPPAKVPALAKPDPFLLASSGTIFVEVTRESGIVQPGDMEAEPPYLSNPFAKETLGVSIEDYDKDGYPDLFIAGAWAGLYRNLGGFRFEEVTQKAGLAILKGTTTSAAFGDFDNDGWPDLFINHYPGEENAERFRSRLFRNRGDGTFEDATERSGILTKPVFKTAFWLDYDLDGALDLYILYNGDRNAGRRPNLGDSTNAEPNTLYRNNGDGTFTDVTSLAGVGDTRWALAGTVLDFDGDGLPDIYVVNDWGKDVLYRNLGNGKFKDVSEKAGVADLGHGMGVSVGDFDHDGWPDLYVTNIGVWNPTARYIRPNPSAQVQIDSMQERFFRIKEANKLYRNRRGTFVDVTRERMEPVRTGWGWNGFFFDFDNDGYLDLHVANGAKPIHVFYGYERNVLLHYDPASGRYRDVSSVSGVNFPGNSRGGAYADLDGDGFLDLVVAGLHAPKIFRNTLKGNGNHWIGVRLEGAPSSSDSIGARVTVRAGDLTLTEWVGGQGGNLDSQCGKELHFGLGPRNAVDRIEVRWLSGRELALTNIPADQRIVLKEPGGTQSRIRITRP